jgi:hypothetical protein
MGQAFVGNRLRQKYAKAGVYAVAMAKVKARSQYGCRIATLGCRPAAVDGQDGAGDVVAGGAAEEGGHGGDAVG